MSQHKGNHVKRTGYISEVGELPNTKNLIGMFTKEAVRKLRENPRLRSPFGFCGPRRSI